MRPNPNPSSLRDDRDHIRRYLLMRAINPAMWDDKPLQVGSTVATWLRDHEVHRDNEGKTWVEASA